jgi:hypothetical protein
MILVSTVNNIGSDTEFILRGRSFIQLQTIEAMELIPNFNVPQSEKKL